MESNLLRSNFGNIEGGFLCNNQVSIQVNSMAHQLHHSTEPMGSLSNTNSGIELTSEEDFLFWRSSTMSSELIVGPGYRIHVAIYKGEVRAVKIYEGPDSRERLLEDMNLNRCLSHSTVLRTVAGCKTAPRPFVILDTGIGHSLGADLGSLQTLSCYLAHALTGCERDCLLAGAKLFDLIIDAANNISISVGVRQNEIWTERRLDNVGGYFEVFQRQCSKEFDSAKSERNGAGLSETSDDVTPVKFDLDVESLSFTLPGDIPTSRTPQREYVFIPERTSISLRRISEKYDNLIRLLSDETVSIDRWRRNAPFPAPSTVAHRCPEYRRQEVTMGTLVTPSVQSATNWLRKGLSTAPASKPMMGYLPLSNAASAWCGLIANVNSNQPMTCYKDRSAHHVRNIKACRVNEVSGSTASADDGIFLAFRRLGGPMEIDPPSRSSTDDCDGAIDRAPSAAWMFSYEWGQEKYLVYISRSLREITDTDLGLDTFREGLGDRCQWSLESLSIRTSASYDTSRGKFMLCEFFAGPPWLGSTSIPGKSITQNHRTSQRRKQNGPAKANIPGVNRVNHMALSCLYSDQNRGGYHSRLRRFKMKKEKLLSFRAMEKKTPFVVAEIYYFTSCEKDTPLVSIDAASIDTLLPPKFSIFGTIFTVVVVLLLAQYSSLTTSLGALQVLVTDMDNAIRETLASSVLLPNFVNRSRHQFNLSLSECRLRHYRLSTTPWHAYPVALARLRWSIRAAKKDGQALLNKIRARVERENKRRLVGDIEQSA
ncbi:hypothetical protein C8J56DRAFT_1033790 [Mycena floridula]|nr:hypothetical protein C8J56DRAFT_1033790 [Mycena floridula]